jgi:alpha-L-fucosidase
MKFKNVSRKTFFCFAIFCLLHTTTHAVNPDYILKHGSHRTGKRTDADMQRWREYGLGQFIHWGVYAIPGGHWQGKAFNDAAEWIRSWDEMPNEAYDQLYKQFNPTKFNAKQWAKTAKEMGARYMIFTTKHHDGFCLWPSRYTNYTIVHSPYKKDIVKEVVDAYTAEGIDVYLYFSIIDWNHPGYRSQIPETDSEKQAYEQFKQFTRNQILELLTNYPEIKGMWFDGSWDKAWINETAWADDLEKELREKHPGLIIGSRFRADEYGKRNFDSNGQLMGDYEQGWERDLPNTIEDVHGNDWDCIMTVPENQWGYHSAWKGYLKTSYDLIEMLAKSVSLNGNFVLNFGPDGQGAIRPEETRLAKEIGDWMKINKEAIYNCEYAGLETQGWGYYTKKGDKLYAIVFNKPISNKLKLVFPKDGLSPGKAHFLQDKTDVEIIHGGKNKKNDTIYYLAIPADYTIQAPFVIEIDITGNRNKGDAYQQART